MNERQRPLRGVNLGGWLVLEKWMTPSVFSDSTAEDEYTLCSLPWADLAKRLKQHRDTFITKEDFIWLRDHGIEAVRLPVGYWVFGDEPPYLGTLKYVDKAFTWAEETGLKVLLDLHAAPGSQNGWDHSGRAGSCDWHKNEQNIIRTLSVLTELSKRYGKQPSLLGIELLNEPKWTIPRRKLLKYYESAYRMVRAECGPDVWVVFHDSFRPRRWKRKLRAPQYAHTYIDTHQYQTFNKKDKKLDVFGHMKKTLKKLPKQLRSMAKRHPVIVGEWSLALDPLSLNGLDERGVDAAVRAYAAAQLIAYQDTAAWFFWSYKTESSGMWSYRNAIELGWLPENKNPAPVVEPD
ncbi:MAG TPA: glycoside hydrolase family 5 protein [Candidatus Limnocylindrales bacterium]|nr:glycoside hydrolase family 5 protein [Candidatus Limnocylindrales bacterium]